jgi:hypothetical protein
VLPFSLIELDFEHPQSIQVEGGIGKEHLFQSGNPISTVDQFYNKFTILRIEGSVAIGDFVVFGSAEYFLCRDNVLCSPGVYKNTRIQLENLNFSSLEN